MAHKGKEIAFASTPSRAHSTKNSNRGRGETFPADRFDKEIHYDRWKALEHRGYVHERIIRLPEEEPDFLRAHVLGLGWGFIYSSLVRINVTMVWEFCANFSSAEQDVVLFRGVKIPFTEDAIRRHLGIRIYLPDPAVDDAFEAVVKMYKESNLNMEDVFRVIGREDTNWADDPAVDTIPNPLDHAILKAHALAWHKVIMENIDPNLLASECRVLEYLGDEFYTVREVEMYCPYGDWKGERPRIRRGRLVPPRHPPQD
ncbi:hypothetical protein PIB30_098393 [Stylosanthes scabra]|uniref:Uncharacterized protein n=1 Tax=Stylosanthes scabra TaxID=79078 RepID=A0ABU6RXV7_9FABA|nr:hypothetical protein [Stylosanthes scabra]